MMVDIVDHDDGDCSNHARTVFIAVLVDKLIPLHHALSPTNQKYVPSTKYLPPKKLLIREGVKNPVTENFVPIDN